MRMETTRHGGNSDELGDAEKSFVYHCIQHFSDLLNEEKLPVSTSGSFQTL